MSSNDVIFGISGSISAYKSLDVIRLLKKSSFNITPILSKSADKFVTPWSVETLAEAPIISTEVELGKITHLDALKKKSLFVICPASANMIAKLATGLADCILSAAFLSYTGPKLIFPAMHTEMLENPITMHNLTQLEQRGVRIIFPDTGELACGDIGAGRLPQPECIAQVVQSHCYHPNINLSGKHIIITAGGTREAIDPVRSITNSASGVSGHALANIAHGFGAKVTLIRTVSHPVFTEINCIGVSSAAELSDQLMGLNTSADALFMNAAVSDFSTTSSTTKQSRGQSLTLDLMPTSDILKSFNQSRNKETISIGYCLSDHPDILSIAYKKLTEKQCDYIVANTPDNFGRESRSITLIDSKNNHQKIEGSITTISGELLSKTIPV